MSIRPRPYSPKRIQTFYMDFVSGRGFTDAGTMFTSNISRGYKNPSLEDKLETVYALMDPAGSEATIIFTGQVPKINAIDVEPDDDADTIRSRHWLLVRTGAWKSIGHWLGAPPTGRFEHEVTHKYIEVRTAAEWFGSTPLTPPQAREAFMLLELILVSSFRSYLPSGVSSMLMKTPAATGANLWAHSMPKQIELVPLTDDIAEELHATSGQHHVEHTVAGPSLDRHEDVLPLIEPGVLPSLDSFSAIDGRYMYAALCNQLGVGPGTRLNRARAADLLREQPYARARYRIKFTVPAGWRNVGVFGMQHRNVREGWYYPNRPGAVGETWADGAEIFVAQKFGWQVEPLEAVVFNEKKPTERKKFHGDETDARRAMTDARPLDAWAKKLTEARYNVTLDPSMESIYKMAMGAALRAILIQTVGKFASRGRSKTVVTYNPMEVSAYAQSLRPVRFGEAHVYKVPTGSLSAQQLPYYRPELAAQVWGRARARVLYNKTNGHECGVLTLPGNSILGVNGDAVYTSHLPTWARSVEDGGADDGKVGRLRLQGYLSGPLKTPVLRDQRDKMAAQAVKAGTNISPELFTDQATFDFEFDYQNDDITMAARVG